MFDQTIEDRRTATGTLDAGDGVRHLQRLATSLGQHVSTIGPQHQERSRTTFEAVARLQSEFAGLGFDRLAELGQAYLIDAWQRGVLTADTLRERGNIFEAHNAAGAPPVLCFDYDIIVDGHDLERPVNYMLLAIRAPAGVEIHDWKRPYMIIDPRAGHGPGIGGFKDDSQVGVALHAGHPVYFVAFRQHPEPGQTLADVMRAEAYFLKEIARRHPDAPQPIVVGNCQGGWATLLLAAANPDITGPIVINGAPVSAWSGVNGRSPMRYSGGLLGGALPANLIADLGAGLFDGAHLVMNFEGMNPGRNWFRKYYDLFARVDHDREKFLDFERWWGGFYFLNDAEIHWILENIFVGNRLSRGEARLEHGRAIDLKAIRAPIIVFASHGDAITPPQQALNWIVDTYVDEQEIKIRGQRIIYMVHESVGHLGIFVSSSVARKEHTEVASILKMIEALPPGLYEMVIEATEGSGTQARFQVSLKERHMTDILAINADGRAEEADFGAVARLSELAVENYNLLARPLVRALATPASAKIIHDMHPLRMQRRIVSDRVPGAAQLRSLAAAVAKDRRTVAADNPFSVAEAIMADLVEQCIDFTRDVRDAWFELAFFGIYGSPFMRWVGQNHNFQRAHKDKDQLRYLPEVQSALANISRGGLAEAVVRMLVLVAEARESVRSSRLERAAYALNNSEPFASLSTEERARMIREQTLIVQFDLKAAISTLVDLLPDLDTRAIAAGTVDYIVGPVEEMEEHTIRAMQNLRRVLELPPLRIPVEQPEPSAADRPAMRLVAERA
jgi:pimeloyl-ACP methyl ester carboxylesterase/tellurite resistance protein